MPRGVKGSGKSKTTTELPQRRRGRKPRAPHTGAVQQQAAPPPAEAVTTESPAGELVVHPEQELNGQAPLTPVQDPKSAAAEAAIVEKYPNRNIVPGSLRPGAAEGWGSKRILTILCAACNQPRTVATSDIFHVSHCVTCAKSSKKAARKARKEGR